MADWTLVTPQRDIARLATERVFGTPHPRLARHVLTYSAHDDRNTAPMSWVVAPLGVITVTVDLDLPRRWATHPVPVSPVLGLRDRPLELHQCGHARGITIALTPLGAYRLFGRPLRELANQSVALADLLGARARRLTERLGEAPTWAARFQVLDDRLTAWLREGPRPADQVLAAWDRLTTSAGRIRIDSLAEEVGWTRQHLAVRFRQEIGLGPKTVARVARLHRATSLMDRPSPPAWAAIAAHCGYADQAHLNRDFRTLTGSTPTDYRPATG